MKNYLFIDLEATDLDITTAKICQIGLIFNDIKKSILINPEVSITNSYIHGITDADVIEQRTFADVAPKIVDLINKATCLIGHNIKNYDWPLLYIELLRAGYNIKKPQIIDTLDMVKQIDGSNKLKDVYLRYFKKPLENQHNAIHDIQATADIYEYLIKNYYS
jgi:DNA polymerase-3 subunit epsilon